MDFDTARRLVFDTYLASLPAAQAAVDDRATLDRYLGDVDRQAGSMDMAVRMALAGRVFAASVALAGGDPPSLDQVRGLIDARLTYGRAQREHAAPLADGRLDPEDEAESGLGELIAEADDDELAEECATVASYLLQFGLQARADIDAWLTVGGELRELSLEGQAALDITGAFGLGGEGPGALLSRAAANARNLAVLCRGDQGRGRPGASVTARETWIQMSAALVAARARWIGFAVDWDPAIARATERIASSQVLEEPGGFAAAACADHALTVVLDAATAWLDDALSPVGESPEEAREFIWEGLLEAASSGLVGAWVEAQPRD